MLAACSLLISEQAHNYIYAVVNNVVLPLVYVHIIDQFSYTTPIEGNIIFYRVQGVGSNSPTVWYIYNTLFYWYLNYTIANCKLGSEVPQYGIQVSLRTSLRCS